MAALQEHLLTNTSAVKASGTANGGIWHLAFAGWLDELGLKPSQVLECGQRIGMRQSRHDPAIFRFHRRHLPRPLVRKIHQPQGASPTPFTLNPIVGFL